MQRPFIRDKGRMMRPVDSLLRGLALGAMLLWKTKLMQRYRRFKKNIGPHEAPVFTCEGSQDQGHYPVLNPTTQGRVPVRLLDRDAMSVRFGPGCDARGNHVGRTLWRESMHVSQRLHRCEPDLLRCELPQATIRYNGMRVHRADQRPLDYH